MKQIPKAEGKCLFCGKSFAKAGIIRHLQVHLRQKAEENAAGHSYLVKIETDPRYNEAPYFLSLWIDGRAIMKNIDSFLRDIWLECCGHMSSFTNPKNRQRGSFLDFFVAEDLISQGKMDEYEKFMEETKGEIPMNRKVNEVFYKGLKLEYEYDFGSSADLLLTVMEEFLSKPIRRLFCSRVTNRWNYGVIHAGKNQPRTSVLPTTGGRIVCSVKNVPTNMKENAKTSKSMPPCRSLIHHEWAFASILAEILIRKEMVFL
jgi:hypothetical protein